MSERAFLCKCEYESQEISLECCCEMQCDISGCTGLWVVYCLDELLLHLFIGYSCVPVSLICVNSCVQKKMSFYLSHLVSPLESYALSKL